MAELNGTFERAKFIRQKCYIEQIEGKLKITCAGMPEDCYEYVNWDNFKTGLSVPRKINIQICQRWR